MHIEDLLFSVNGKIIAERNRILASCTRARRGVELHISRLEPHVRLFSSTSVNIIIFLIKRDFSFKYKTVWRHPGFRDRFPSVDFAMCGSVFGAGMLHVRFVNGRNCRKYTSRFRLSTGHFCLAALAIFILQTIKNGL